MARGEPAASAEGRLRLPARGVQFITGDRLVLPVATLVAWAPIETRPWSMVAIAAAILAAAPWAWDRTAGDRRCFPGIAAIACVILLSGLSGADPEAAIHELALAALVVAMAWLASRVRSRPRSAAILALLISGLALWAVWQVAIGFNAAAGLIGEMAPAMQAAAAERVASGRAFASQILPSHLAVLLATALPILVARIRRTWRCAPWAIGAGLAVVGLMLTRSPIGIVLGLLACAALALRGRRMTSWIVATVLALMFFGAVVMRGDVRDLEPVRLRADNWQTALWVWSTAPAVGVGVGGFAQASQKVPFDVGNRPRHAHSLPLEWLAELGPIGLISAVVLGIALLRRLCVLWPRRPDLAAAVAIVPVHNLIDFSLYGSGVAVPWAVLLGWAIADSRPADGPHPRRSGRLAVVVAVTLFMAAAVLDATSRTVAAAAAAEPSSYVRFTRALTAHRLAPWRVEPTAAAALAALASGDRQLTLAAAKELDAAMWLRPRSAGLADLRSRVAWALQSPLEAVAWSWQASQCQPRNNDYRRRFEALIDGRQRGNRHAHP